jgi:hypothetical protein
MAKAHMAFVQVTKQTHTAPIKSKHHFGVRHVILPFKMADVTNNINFLNCPLLLYYQSKLPQNVIEAI